MTHYHAIAGTHGCMPNFNTGCETYEDAVSSLAVLHELGRDRRRALRRDSYLELNPKGDGNEYCEIVVCHDDDCAE